tara:strand:+ start:826 stop:957 length:132 start_codon:yes stop_codon:yes gene_type:complete
MFGEGLGAAGLVPAPKAKQRVAEMLIGVVQRQKEHDVMPPART